MDLSSSKPPGTAGTPERQPPAPGEHVTLAPGPVALHAPAPSLALGLAGTQAPPSPSPLVRQGQERGGQVGEIKGRLGEWET